MRRVGVMLMRRFGFVRVVLMPMRMTVRGFCLLVPLFPVPCSLRDHIHLDRRQPAAAHLAHLQTCAHIQGQSRFGQHAEGNACIHQRAQQHVATDPGKTLQIANTHRSVILEDLLRF